MKRKNIVLLCAFFAVALICLVVAWQSTPMEKAVASEWRDAVELVDEKVMIGREGVVYAEAHHGGGSYYSEFALHPDNGDRLEIDVTNNRDVYPVYVHVERTDSGERFEAIPLAAGEQLERVFAMEDERGMEGTWKVHVYSKIGDPLDIRMLIKHGWV